MITYNFYQKYNALYPVPEAAVQAACDDAVKRYPQESCGVVYNDTYYPFTNVHEKPEHGWRINLQEHINLWNEFGRPQAVIHSHPEGVYVPSRADFEYSITSQLTCGLVVLHNKQVADVFFWGDQVKRPPLVGRPFIYGVYDCWQLYRDAFFNDFGVWLKTYPSDDKWWSDPKAESMFEDYYAEVGFVPVDISTMKRGDMLLGKFLVASKVNHCAYYLGHGKIVHHFSGRLSNEDIVYQWKRYITHCLRHRSQL